MTSKRIFGKNFFHGKPSLRRPVFINATCAVCDEPIGPDEEVLIGVWNRKDGWQQKGAHVHPHHSATDKYLTWWGEFLPVS